MSNRGFVVFAIVWLSLAYLLYDIRPLAIITGAWTRTESSRYGFSIEHPAKWVARQYGERGWRGEKDVIFILSSDADPGFNKIWIQRQVISNPITMPPNQAAPVSAPAAA